MEPKKQVPKRIFFKVVAVLAIAVLAAAGAVALYRNAAARTRYSSATYAMSTLVDQKAYGSSAEAAMDAVEKAFIAFEQQLSLYREDSDIQRINAAAGQQSVCVQPSTYALLHQAVELSRASEGAFALTIAPLTLAWGITSDSPRVPPQEEIDALLALVDDGDIILQDEDTSVMLAREGQALDLGGIAKGTACNVARDIYKEYGVKSALLSIGGNIYVHGTKPDGSLYRIGFRDPSQDALTAVASFAVQDVVFAVSGGYERYFEQDGVRYHHILDPATGMPAESDIVSVGVMDADGTRADFYSTTLFVWGSERALEFMREGGTAVMLTEDGTLYVSKSLEDTFRWENKQDRTVVFV